MSAARDAILAAVRENLAAARTRPGDARPAAALPTAERGAAADRGAAVQRFVEALEQVGGGCSVVRSADEAAAALRAFAAEGGLQRWVHSGAPELAPLLAGLEGSVQTEADGGRSALLEADAGLTAAQWGVAETGTLVLASQAERHRLVSLLPPVHVALLDARSILPDLGSALAAVHDADPARMSPTVTFVTGPSRTADIEMNLVIGVHGPTVLHVLILDPPSA